MSRERAPGVIRHAELALVGSALAVAAAIAPLPLYLVALALFGLPHVLWELAWVRLGFAARVTRRLALLFGAALALQAVARLGAWHGDLSPQTTGFCDALSLLLLLLVVASWPVPRHDARAIAGKAAAFAFATGIVLALRADSLVVLLLLLAIAHNLTPLLIGPLASLPGAPGLLRPLSLLFGGTLLAGAALAAFVATQPADSALRPVIDGADAAWIPAEAGWLAAHTGVAVATILSLLVLAQCLHYYAVLRVLPAAAGAAWRPARWRGAAVVASGLLTAYFLVDFSDARRLYAVAAGVHAWLEWPLVLVALAGLSPPAPTPASCPRTG